MSSMIKTALFILLLVSMDVLASQETGRIERILINKDIPNAVILNVASDVEPTKATCVTGWEWVIDISTETGKAQYSLALALYMSGKTIVIQGNDNCDAGLYGHAELVRYIYPK
ncbi:hypothetical protein [Teredinibacter sp. KSP-S5-2]|uniref:hypothetical protein n=1 Tax=Teredinibacter sp. KSP-S5-2 TaxID=3034506 RepID=UPI002934D5C2|nr:hypothetical protein [Teredinibacter sp. KSP-S5-2]WNO07820.1 hypothetical protein P5V12_12555 [Teredinibacter sp. KSP-S5-2]